MKRTLLTPLTIVILTLLIGLSVRAGELPSYYVYLPVTLKPAAPPTTPQPQTEELRGLWVSRFDWTTYFGADPTKIDEIVNNAAAAGFNAIFFQVRGTADALYQSDLEPWSRRVSGSFGEPPDPFWDPLSDMVEKAHAQNIQVHAYINVYPVWGCSEPPETISGPQHLYYLLKAEHGMTDGKNNGLQWTSTQDVSCSGYWRATPASIFVDNHLIAVGKDLVTRYDIDGLHLDHIRYGGPTTSCDPVSQERYGDDCYAHADYGDWQREQVNGTVRKFYEEVVPLKENLWLSAAVWPIYETNPEWNFPGTLRQGNAHYYQDSKAWLAGDYIDSISPMIYPSNYNDCDEEGNYIEDPTITSKDYWLQSRWETLVTDFQASSNGRFIIPGIGTGYCSFAEIEARIEMARTIGTAGHALFSYSDLLANAYFDDLANGPYAETAVVPTISWHP